jgi:FkbM family methyltransferase
MTKVRARKSPLNRATRIFQKIWSHPANRGGRAAAIARAVGWQLQKRLLGRPLETRVFNNVRFICHPDSAFASDVMYFGSYYEWDELHFAERYLRPGDHFVDIGANVGIYTLLAASIVGPKGSVQAVEAFPLTANRLEENVRANAFANVTVHRLAAADRDGEVSFISDADTSNRIKTDSKKDAGWSTVTVPCSRVDRFLPNDRRYAMAKMDVEGAEPMVLRGATELLQGQNPPVWLLEVNPWILRRHGVTVEQCLLPFVENGFVFATYSADDNALVYRETFGEEVLNLLAIHKSAKSDVEARLQRRPSGLGAVEQLAAVP